LELLLFISQPTFPDALSVGLVSPDFPLFVIRTAFPRGHGRFSFSRAFFFPIDDWMSSLPFSRGPSQRRSISDRRFSFQKPICDTLKAAAVCSFSQEFLGAQGRTFLVYASKQGFLPLGAVFFLNFP